MKFLCIVSLAAVALAQTPSEPKPAAVEGKIVNSLTGEPIRKAELTLTTSLFDGMAGMGVDIATGLGLDDLVPPDPKPNMPRHRTPPASFGSRESTPAITTSR